MKETLFFLAFMLAIIGMYVGVIFFTDSSREEATKQDKFIGACDYVGGKVTDNLCIKDDRVVIRRKA